MENLILFLNSFLSYAFMFLVIVALCILACFIGVGLRKRKNAAMQAEEKKETSVL